MESISRWRELAVEPGARGLAASGLTARLPSGMDTLLLVLATTTAGHGSFAAAGTIVACYSVASAVAAPWRGRLVDRYGARPVLLLCGVVEAVALVVFVAATHADWPVTVRCLIAATIGAARPPVPAVMRMLWRRKLGERPVADTAFALESVMTDVTYVLGPLIAAAAAALHQIDAALLLAATLVLTGTLAISSHPLTTNHRDTSTKHERGRLGPIHSRRVRRLLAAAFFALGALSAIDLAAIATADEHHTPAAAGLLIAAMSITSILGGLWWGARTHPQPLSTQSKALTAYMTLGALTLTFCTGAVAVTAVAMALTGLALAPLITVQYSLMERAAPAGQLTESYAWLSGLTTAGGGAATAAAGYLIHETGAGGAYALAAGMTTLAVLLSTITTGSSGDG